MSEKQDMLPGFLAHAMAQDMNKTQDLRDQTQRGIFDEDWAPLDIKREARWHPSEYPFKGEWRDHQARSLYEADLKQGHAFWLDPGAGKTGLTIGEASMMWHQDWIDGLLVFSPNGPHAQWITEQFPLWCAVPWHGTFNKAPKKHQRQFFDYPRKSCLSVLSINIEALRTKNVQTMISEFIKHNPRFYLALDESQKCKNEDSQRTQVALQQAAKAGFGRVLSGTPILKGLEDLFTQYSMVAPLVTGFTDFTAYKNYYCRQMPAPGWEDRQRAKGWKPNATYAPKVIVGYKNQAELKKKVAPVTTVVKSEEFRKGEKPLFIPVETPMAPDQRKAHEDMKNRLIAQVDQGIITVSNALTKATKLLQIASGFSYDDDGEVHWGWDNKVDAMATQMESLGEAVLIWSPFIPLRERAIEVLKREGHGKRLVVYKDHTSVQEWKDKGDEGIMIGNQGSGMGVGLNLQLAAANIYLSNLYFAEHRWQSIARTDRMGQERLVRVWDLISPASRDVHAMRTLQNRQTFALSTVNDIKALIEGTL